MRKQRRQPSFATLTDAEIEQIAQSLDGAIYADIRARVNKPRSEGGYGLNLTTDRPLELLWKRTKTVEKINTHITRGEKLTLATFDQITSGDSDHCGHNGENPATDEIHAAILFETMEAVRSGGKSPHQLLALQRLADFPARAALRAQSAQDLSRLRKQALAHRTERNQIARTKEARAQAKAQREAEMHDHKLDMDTFHQNITTQRIDLQKKSLALRETRAPAPCNADNLSAPSRDAITPADAASADLTCTNEKNPSASVDPNSELKTKNSTLARRRFPTPNPLPHDIYLKNCAYTEKLLAGLVDPFTGRELDAPVPSSTGGTRSPSPTSISRDAIDSSEATPPSPTDHVAQTGSLPPSNHTSTSPATNTPTDAAPADQNAGTGTVRHSAQTNTSISRHAMNNTHATPADLTSTDVQNPSSSSDPKSDHDSRSERPLVGHTLVAGLGSQISNQKSEIDEAPSVPETQNSKLKIQNSASLAEAVDTYTISRCREYIAHNQQYTPWPYRHLPPEYITALRHCPCGQATPCPTHESAANGGPFPNIFWKLSPLSDDYAACLRARNLPYRQPKEFLA